MTPDEKPVYRCGCGWIGDVPGKCPKRDNCRGHCPKCYEDTLFDVLLEELPKLEAAIWRGQQAGAEGQSDVH